MIFIPIGLFARGLGSCFRGQNDDYHHVTTVTGAGVPIQYTRCSGLTSDGRRVVYLVPQTQYVPQQQQVVINNGAGASAGPSLSVTTGGVPTATTPQMPAAYPYPPGPTGTTTQDKADGAVRPERRRFWQRRSKGGYTYYEN